jgi:hypothetical protein
MKPINQEILLMTDTTFAKKEWCEKDGQSNQITSTNERLEEACWNGLLNEMLPGVVQKSSTGKNLSLWQIIQRCSFLEIDLYESAVSDDQIHSINPYLLLPLMVCN